MTGSAAMALLFVAVGLLFVGLGVPLARGRVPRNDLYGCRTRATLADDRVWYEANRASGRDMISGGAFVVACALAALAFARRADPEAVTAGLLAALLLAVGRMAVRCWRASARG